MELALFNYLYLNLYAAGKDAVLYFNLSSDTKGKKHYVNIVEHKNAAIKKVEINGRAWQKFSAEEGYIILPEMNNMKIKVTFGMKKK